LARSASQLPTAYCLLQTDHVSLTSIQHSVVACEKCRRLRSYCARVAAERRRAYRGETYWGRPVPGFGDPAARLLIVGLAPAAHGGNRTGRVFTGDSSGDFLFRALHEAGFANQPASVRRGDGLKLTGAYIAAAVRCAPPDNKPTPAELARCLPWLAAELDELTGLRAIVALGRIAFDATLKLLRDRGFCRAAGASSSRPVFGHGLVYEFVEAVSRPDAGGSPHAGPLTLIASYHPSRQNTNTGRLTVQMFDEVFALGSRIARSSTSQDRGAS
jgi:uracil-DNA glycosylase